MKIHGDENEYAAAEQTNDANEVNDELEDKEQLLREV